MKLKILFTLIMLVTTILADSVTIEGITYETIDANNCRVIDCDESKTYARILGQAYINGSYYTVKSIGFRAIMDCSILENLTIPGGLTEIGDEAFSGCSSLISLTLPAGVVEIGASAFFECSSLISINIPAGVTEIGNRVFFRCSSLESIIIPAGVTEIESDAFYGCSSLTNINIPDGVTSISPYTFYGCSSLPGITLPAGVTEIGFSAFEDCSSLPRITIPARVTEIGSSVFFGCSSLLEIKVSTENMFYSSQSGVLFNKNKTILLCCPGGKSVSYSVPAGVTEIGSAAFYGCRQLSSLVIPESMISISVNAFFNCLTIEGIEFQGNAPDVDFTAMPQFPNLVIYRHNGKTGFETPTWQGYPCKTVIDLVPTKSCKGKLNFKKGSIVLNIWSILPETLRGQTGTLNVTLEGQPLMQFEDTTWKWNKKETAGKTVNELKEKVKLKIKGEKSFIKLSSKTAIAENFDEIIAQGQGVLSLEFLDAGEILQITIQWNEKGKVSN